MKIIIQATPGEMKHEKIVRNTISACVSAKVVFRVENTEPPFDSTEIDPTREFGIYPTDPTTPRASEIVALTAALTAKLIVDKVSAERIEQKVADGIVKDTTVSAEKIEEMAADEIEASMYAVYGGVRSEEIEKLAANEIADREEDE